MAEDPLVGIRKRDKDSRELWFTGPESFVAMAARDRRILLSMYDNLVEVLQEIGGYDCQHYDKILRPTPCGICITCIARKALRDEG